MNRHDVDCTALPDAQDRAVLRQRLRRFLETHWPAPAAIQQGTQPAVIHALWQGLANQGVAALGAEPAAGGLREIVVAMEEIGRAGCPLPLAGHLLGNLVLARANARGEPIVDGHVRRRLHDGALRMTFAFAGGHPSDHGAISFDGRHASGCLQGVDAALQATHLLLCVADGLLVADLGSPGVSVIGAAGSACARVAQVRLEHTSVDAFALPAVTIADLRLLARLVLAAREQAAARRTFELALQGARGGVIEGQVRAALQALDGLRLRVDRASEAFDGGRPRWREFGLVAATCADQALGQMTLTLPASATTAEAALAAARAA
jgi:hypothetical protein